MGSDHLGVAPVNLFVLILLFGFVRLVFRLTFSQRPNPGVPKLKTPRPLKPKSAADCPFCRAEELARQSDNPINEEHPRQPPLSWRSTRSRRGRKKASRTEGFACHNPACPYYGITDQTRHALVFDGAHGKHERIQDLRCQACGHKFTVRHQTVLYRLETHSARVAEALTFLAEGVDVSVLEQFWRVRESTLRTWLTRAGLQAQELHARFFQNLRCAHIQLDELWANVRQAGQDVWVWAALDATTKIVPVIRLGPRTLHLAYAVVHELHHRLQPGSPLPIFTTDGLRLYFYALTAHFGCWLQPERARKPVWQIAADFIYGQVRKFQRRRRLVKVERVMLWGERETLTHRLKAAGLSGRLNTAFIERLNLTLRQGVALLTRRTWGTAQFTSELVWHVEWWRANYHFARYHEALRMKRAVFRLRKGRPSISRYRSQTPATLAPRWRAASVQVWPPGLPRDDGPSWS